MTVPAQGLAWNLVFSSHRRLTPHTCLFLHGKAHDRPRLSYRCRFAYRTCMVSVDEDLWVGYDRFEYASQRIGQLICEVVPE